MPALCSAGIGRLSSYCGVVVLPCGVVVEAGLVVLLFGTPFGEVVVPVEGLTPVVEGDVAVGPSVLVPVPVVVPVVPLTELVPFTVLVPVAPVLLVPLRLLGLVDEPDVVPTADPLCPAVPVPMLSVDPATPVVPCPATPVVL